MKVWRLEWTEETGRFQMSDSAVFVFQDRGREDLARLQTVLRQLVGDGSLDEVMKQRLSTFQGEIELKGEPDVKIETNNLETDEITFDDHADINGESSDEDGDDPQDEDYIDDSNKLKREKKFTNKPNVKVNGSGAKDIGSFPCDHCNQSLKTEKALLRHKTKAHTTKNSKKLFSCEHKGCAEIFVLRKQLWSHMLSAHGIDVSPENKDRYVCSDCGKKCLSKHEFEKHIVKHTDKKEFVCMECGKQFKGESGLKIHMKRHQGIFDHKCVDCEAAYTSASALYTHRLAKHTDHSFMCPECGKGFKYLNAMDRHRTLHTGEKPYQCRFCEKRFRLYIIRSKHERLHKGVKEFQCTMCPKQFMQQDHLRVHLKRHLNQRDHVCPVCAKAFIEPAGLRKHHCSGRAPEEIL